VRPSAGDSEVLSRKLTAGESLLRCLDRAGDSRLRCLSRAGEYLLVGLSSAGDPDGYALLDGDQGNLGGGLK
jgi:hypothetical protein